MIEVYVDVLDDIWYGLAFVDERIVATTVGSSKESALQSLMTCLPPTASRRIVGKGSAFAGKMIYALRDAHLGIRELDEFSLASEYFEAPILRILEAAAVIPIGYVASYGEIARVSGTEPQLVGKAMASNPIYPIVACHRVVGADFSLVGYGGGRRPQALNSKMERLRKERRGFKSEKGIHVFGEELTVYPVEYVVDKAAGKKPSTASKEQRTLASF